MAYEHLKQSLTRGNLWIYVLSTLEAGPASPGEIRKKVQARHGFSPAKITFYSVLYKLRREGWWTRHRLSSGLRTKSRLQAGRSSREPELSEKVRKSASQI